MKILDISPRLVKAIENSMMFRTFARIYENEFGVPLYFESTRQRGGLRKAGNESAFCVELNGGDGCCTRCACRLLPPPETLMPWTWSAPCRAGQQVTMVPLIGLGVPIAWMVSGHYFIGGENCGTRELPREAIRAIGPDRERREDMKRAFREVKSVTKACHEAMVHYLETCCALIGANLNHFLADGDQEMPWAEERQAVDVNESETPDTEILLGEDEIAVRCRLETARRKFLHTEGQDEDIACAAQEAGWSDEGEFRRNFHECFGESPSEHRQRVTGLWHDFSGILASSE